MKLPDITKELGKKFFYIATSIFNKLPNNLDSIVKSAKKM